MDKKLVDHLVERGLISRKDIQRCVLRAAMSADSVVDEMLSRFELDQEDLCGLMAEFWGIDHLPARPINAQPFALRLVTADDARGFGVLPLRSEPGEDMIELAVYDVDKAQPVIEKIREKTGVSPTLVLVPFSTLEREVFRHYSSPTDDATPPQATSKPRNVPARGVVKQVLRKPQTPPPRAAVVTERDFSDPDPPPTRQIDLTDDDNPFMDLVQQTRSAPSTSSPPRRRKVVPVAPEPIVDDFFDLQPAAGAEETVVHQDPAQSEPSEAEESPDLESALAAFDASLDEPESESEPALAPSASIDWGDADAAQSAFGRPSTGGSGLRPLPAEDPYDVEGSGIFPLERDPSGFFRLEEESAGELTIMEVVDRQRKMIRKLEREVEHQKGILQTMAELLIEARVLSRRKLKARLKALRQQQLDD